SFKRIGLDAITSKATDVSNKGDLFWNIVARDRVGNETTSDVDADEILDDCLRTIDAFHDPSPYAMRRIDLAPCSPFSISPELLDETRDLARELGVLLHTHAAETLDEQRYCLERFGRRPIAFLHEHGWLGEDVYLAHCVHLSDEEIDLLARTRTGVSHCPCSNMCLGSGVAPLGRLMERGVKLGPRGGGFCRMVTHADVNSDDVDYALDVIESTLREYARG
ncbi:MAG: amidohydrolase family protein, partial [Gemmatimonadetes bacterium]|nr:amidohydrolase family protein [Gemmatimonadota bacterium]